MKIFNRPCLSVTAAVLTLFACSLPAQNSSATATGTVSDTTGAAIPGASVTLTATETGVVQKTETNGAGLYRIGGLIPGVYGISIIKDGFQSVTQQHIEIHVGETATLNYSMTLGSVKETVTVSATGVILDESTSTVGQVIDDRQIQDTPLNGRNVMNLLALAPGVVPQGATSGSPLNNQPSIGNYTNPAGWSNYQIGGGVAGQNALALDGAPLNVPIQNWVGLIPAEDSIREFRVDSSNISPEYGRYYGGVINFSTKSGTNEFHGTASEYFRNTVLNANNFFNNRAGTVRPPLNQNQYGLAGGGPVIRNKMFFFANWEAFANRAGLPYAARVPTAAEQAGDFTHDAPIYYAGTTNQVSCNGVANKVCIDPTANYIVNGWKYWPHPNLPNIPEGGVNYQTNASSGSNSDQVSGRLDYNLEHHQLFGRYTWWNTNTLPTNYFHNNLPQPAVLSTTQQAVGGDTWTLTPSTVADVRVSYLRFLFSSVPPALGHVDFSNFPGLAPYANQFTFNLLPIVNLSGYSPSPYPFSIINVIQFFNFDTYNLSVNISHTSGRHTIRAGGNAQRLEGYFSPAAPSGPTGTFVFLNNNPTTNLFANFLLGNPIANSSAISTGIPVSTVEPYAGFYVLDTYKATAKLTINAGIRWDIPSGFLEKHDLNTMLLPGAPSPLGSIANPATGGSQALHGNLVLVNSPSYSSRYDDSSHYNLFAPSIGLAYRLFSHTVLRSGYSLAYLPNDTGSPSPTVTPITLQTTPVTGTLSNPFPQLTNGILPQPLGRNPNYSATIQGLGISGRVPNVPYPYVQQWNFNIQQELGKDSVLQVGYSGSKGTHLKVSLNLNPISDALATQAASQYQALLASGLSTTAADAQTFLNVKVANPLAGKLATGSAYNGAMISQGQLLRPFPQFNAVSDISYDGGDSIYHALQVSYRKRFSSAGQLLASYTWAKVIGTVDSTTGFLEFKSVGGTQDPNNLSAQRALTSFDVPHRVSLNYSLTLPAGKGRRLLSNAGTIVDGLVSHWTLSSITTFQSGYPLALTAQPNDLNNSFGFGGIRPIVVSGCHAEVSGSAQSRLNRWFNTACYVQPPTPFSWGNEGRTDAKLRTAGIANWDLALTKEISFRERARLMFTGQFLNAFNRVQFGQPGVQVGSISFGQVTSEINNPRQIQFGLRLSY
jgi:Carboxypeptidase regulatory-like domain